jgi:HlyD family secretion protein
LRRSPAIVVGLAVLVVVAGAWFARSRSAHQAPRYRTALVERGDVSATVSATGTVQPVEQVEVGSQVSGTVYRLNADYNSVVEQGQVLCELEPAAFRARSAQNEASVARAEAALEDGRRQLRRAGELSQQQLVSQADLEAAQVTVQQREADLKSARAMLAASRVDLGNTIIRAPISGVVISRNIDLGQTVAASLQAPKLFVIARDLTQMQVETSIDEADIGVIHPGLPVTFTVDAFPDDQFRGEVSVVRLEPVNAQGVVTYTTVIRTRNPELKLRPGMTANVTVLVARHESVIKVPAAALRFHPPEAEGRGHAERAGGVAPAGGQRGGEGGSGRPGAASAGDTAGTGERAGGAAGPAVAGVPDGHGRPAERDGRPGRDRAGPDARSARATIRSEFGTPAGAPPSVALGAAPTPSRPGSVYLLRDGKLAKVAIRSGLSDGTNVEVVSGEIRPGDTVVIGSEVSARAQGMTPPPGMGGPFGGPRGMAGGGGGRR